MTKELKLMPQGTAWLGGVCSGLAYSFELPTALVRGLFLVGLFVGSFTFWLYIILWVIMPEWDKTPEDYKD